MALPLLWRSASDLRTASGRLEPVRTCVLHRRGTGRHDLLVLAGLLEKSLTAGSLRSRCGLTSERAERQSQASNSERASPPLMDREVPSPYPSSKKYLRIVCGDAALHEHGGPLA
jgi:hypothetical protein